MLLATPDAMFCRNIWSSLARSFEFRVSSFESDRSVEPKRTQADRVDLELETQTRKPYLMKAKVYVTLKPSVLDPQGKAIKHSVELLGFNGISDIRQGKYFEIAIDGSRSADDARADAEKLAHDVLSNPIIEDFRVEIEQ
jgi:phosphoribosylformylglycinamidine synthase PurS subunit